MLKVFDITNLHTLGYWLRMFPFPAPLKAGTLNVLRTLSLSRLRVGLKTETIAIIAQKP